MKGKEENNPLALAPAGTTPAKTAAPGVADKVDDGTGDGQRSAGSRQEKTLGSSAKMKLAIQHG